MDWNKDILHKRTASAEPSYFDCTHYRLPTQEEIIEIDAANLPAEKIAQGIGYNMVGKGIKDDGIRAQMVEAAELLIAHNPANVEYKKALELVKR